MTKQVMSYYELADELMIDEYGSNAVNNLKKEANWEAVRKKYRDSRSSYFKDIFGERYKNAKGKYDIPINDKELVKSAILGYTRLKYYKEIRKNRIPTIEHIQEYVSYMDKAIDRTSISSEEKEQLKSEFYTLHQIMSNKASAQAVENVSDLLKEKLVGIKNKKILKSTEVGIKEEISLRNLGEEDVRYLIRYYEKMISNTTRQWDELVEIVSDIRGEEIVNIADMQLDNENENIDYMSQRMSSVEVIEKAIERYKEEN